MSFALPAVGEAQQSDACDAICVTVGLAYSPHDPFPGDDPGDAVCGPFEVCGSPDCGPCANPDYPPDDLDPSKPLKPGQRYATFQPGRAAARAQNWKVELPIDPAAATLEARQSPAPAEAREDGSRIANDSHRQNTASATHQGSSSAEQLGEDKAHAPISRSLLLPSNQSGMAEYLPRALRPVSVAADVAQRENSDIVDPATGEFQYEQTDLELAGIGLPFALTRVYRSRWSFRGSLGFAWTHNFEQQLFIERNGCGGGVVTWASGDGGSLRFHSTRGRHWQSQPSHGFRLLEAEQGWSLTHPDGIVTRFDADGYLSRISDLNGNTLQIQWRVLAWAVEGGAIKRVERVVDTVGREIWFHYDVRHYLQTVFVPSTGATINYLVNSDGDLEQVTDADGFVESYEYLHGYSDSGSYLAATEIDEACEQHCAQHDSNGCKTTNFCDRAADAAAEACAGACFDPAGCANDCAAECWSACASSPSAQACASAGACPLACKTECARAGSARCWYGAVAHNDRSSMLRNCEKHCSEVIDQVCRPYFRCEGHSVGLAIGVGGGPIPLLGGYVTSDGWCVGTGACLGEEWAQWIDEGSDLHYPGGVFGPLPVGMVLEENGIVHSCDNECYECLHLGVNCPGSHPAAGNRCVDECVGERVSACLAVVSHDCAPVCDIYCNNYCNGNCAQICGAACASSCNDPRVCESACRGELASFRSSCETSCFDECRIKYTAPGATRFGIQSELNHNLIAIHNALGPWLINAYEPDHSSAAFDTVFSQTFGPSAVSFRQYDLANVAASPIAQVDVPFVATQPSALEICPRDCIVSSGSHDERWIETAPGEYFVIPELPAVELDLGAVDVPASFERYGWLELFGNASAGTLRPPVETSAEGLALERPEGTLILRTDSDGNAVWSSAGFAPLPPASVFAEGDWHLFLLRTTRGWRAFRADRARLVELSNREACRGDFAVRSVAGALAISPAEACTGRTELEELGVYPAEYSAGLLVAGGRRLRAVFRVGSVSVNGEGVAAPPRCDWTTLANAEPECLGASDPNAPGPAEGCAIHWARRAKDEGGPGMLCGVAEVPATGGAECTGWLPARSYGYGDPVQPILKTSVVRAGTDLSWTYYSDQDGRIVRIVNNLNGAVEDRNYDDRGRLIAIQNGAGERTCFSYDAAGNLLQRVTLPRPGAHSAQALIDERFSWGANSRLQTIWSPEMTSQSLVALEWDQRGNLRSVSYPGTSLTTTYTPDDRGRLQEIRDASGVVTKITYNSTHGQRELVHRDFGGPDSTTQTYEHDSAGRISSLSEPGQPSRRWIWSDGGVLESETIQLASGATPLATTYQRNNAGQVWRIVDPTITRELIFSGRGLAQVVSEYPNGDPAKVRSRCFDYDERGRLREAVDPEGRRSRYERDSLGEIGRIYAGIWEPSADPWDDACPVSDAAAPGVELFRTIERDAAGRVARAIEGSPSAAPPISIQFFYDGFGRAIKTRYSSGESVRSDYDARGLVKWEAIYAPGAAPLPAGLIQGEPNLNDMKLRVLSRFTFDGAERETQRQAYWFADDGGTRTILGGNAGWLTETTSYRDDVRQQQRTDFSGRRATTTFDRLGRPLHFAIDGAAISASWRYEELGRKISTTISPAATPSGSFVQIARFTNFDARTSLSIDSDSNIVHQVEYDVLGRPKRIADRATRTDLIFDAFGALIQTRRVDDAGQSALHQSFDRNRRGEIWQVKDATSAAWKKSFDFANRVRAASDPSFRETTYTYRAGTHLPATISQPNGATRWIQYDGFGEISGVLADWAGAPSSWRETRIAFNRDLLGLTSAVSQNKPGTGADDVILSYRRSSLGHLIETRNSLFADSARFLRDELGRVRGITAGGYSVSRTFDLLDRLESTSSGGLPLATYEYAGGFGGPTTIRHRNGIIETHTYDRELRPRIVTGKVGAGDRFRHSYEWGADGVLARMDRWTSGAAGTSSDLFAGDIFGRITAAAYKLPNFVPFTAPSSQVAKSEVLQAISSAALSARESFVFDAADSLQSKIYAGISTEPQSDADHRFVAFDGAVVSDAVGTALTLPNGTTFALDGFGRTVSVTVPAKGTSELLPDAFGRLTRWSSGAGLTAATVEYAGDTTLREQTGSSTRFFVPGLERGAAATLNGSSIVSHHAIFGDRLGWSANAVGAILERVEYTAHAQPAFYDGAGNAVAASLSGNKLLLTGQAWFGPLELYRTVHRWYRPTWGSFLSRDPLGLPDGPNPYLYAGASPVRFIDPLGLVQESADTAFEADGFGSDSEAAAPVLVSRGRRTGPGRAPRRNNNEREDQLRRLKTAVSELPPEVAEQFREPSIGQMPIEALRREVRRAEAHAATARYNRLSPAEQEALNAIVPPAVQREMQRWAGEAQRSQGEVWDSKGGVDFARSADLYPVGPGQRNIVTIQYTGSRTGDVLAANRAAGLGNSARPPRGYTWHHVRDYDPQTNTGTMQLVLLETHRANQPHLGGVRQYEEATGRNYAP